LRRLNCALGVAGYAFPQIAIAQIQKRRSVKPLVYIRLQVAERDRCCDLRFVLEHGAKNAILQVPVLPVAEYTNIGSFLPRFSLQTAVLIGVSCRVCHATSLGFPVSSGADDLSEDTPFFMVGAGSEMRNLQRLRNPLVTE
jgi:hypothetical protein